MLRSLSIACFFLLASAVPSWAVPQSLTKEETDIAELMRLTNTVENVKALPAAIQSANRERLKTQAPELVSQLQEIAAKAWEPEAFLRSVRLIVAKHYNPGVVGGFLQSLRCPLVDKINAAENLAAKKDVQVELQRLARSLAENPMSESRRKLWARFDKVMGLTEHTVDIQIAVVTAEMESMEAVTPEDRKPPASVRASILAGLRGQIEKTVPETVMLQLELTYSSLTEPELEEYLGLMDTPGGRWFNSTIKEATLRACTEASHRLGELAAKSLLQTGDSPSPK